MHISDFDYDLPEDLIAQTPVEPRDSARLLVSVDDGPVRHLRVSDLDQLLGPGDLLVVNDTRVLPARVHVQRRSGGSVEILLLERTSDDGSEWEALVRPARRLKTGEVLEWFGKPIVRVGERSSAGDTFTVNFVVPDPDDLLGRIGSMPLPPYIHGTLSDTERYQTVYSRRAASAAAPTAGLHFTPELLDRIIARGAVVRSVELVVGLDTFKPISVSDPRDHVIHTESYRVPEGLLEECAAARRVVAVGTTAARALESAAATGRNGGRTDLFIVPGHEWRVVDVLMTNFHMPRTSLLLMVESFIGSRWRDLYAEALSQGYRFLSFGDAMLVSRSSSIEATRA